MKGIVVVGLGYVGTVAAASLAASGRSVIGVDRRANIVDALARFVAPIPEPHLEARLETARSLGTLEASTDLPAAVARAELSLVCVGTPIGEDGTLDVRDVQSVVHAIADAVPEAAAHTIVIRSTVPPGLYERLIAELIARHGDAIGRRISLALNPEFLREGSAIADLESPELIVYATAHEAAARSVQSLYGALSDRLMRTDPATAEVHKLVNNAWHALKVTFANEAARVARANGADPFAVMDLVVKDRRLNTSAAYLRPGLPFGGACLVKDVAALCEHGVARDVAVPLLDAILPSNDAHLDHLVDAVLVHRPKQCAIVGVGFKPGASDVRDSAPVRLVHRLLNAGVHVSVADSGILDSAIAPLGLDALRQALGDPRANAAPDVAHAIAGADVIVVGHPTPSDRRALVALCPRAPILDSAGELSRELSDDERKTLAPVVVLARG